MMKSVLIAGMHGEDNQYIRYAKDLWLDYEHLPELKHLVRIPTKHDATIICADIASHSLFQVVKKAYTDAGKPVFLSKGGVSDIRKTFEPLRFCGADPELYKKITAEGGRGSGNIPISLRFFWILGNLKKPGDVLKYQDFVKFFDKFICRESEKAINQAWFKARGEGVLTDIGTGRCKFAGITSPIKNQIESHGLSIPEESIMHLKPRSISPPIPLSEIEEPIIATPIETIAPEPVAAIRDQGADLSVSADLLLEAMAQQQAEIKSLKEMIEVRIPEVIQKEIRGISTMLGSLVPKLQGLTPDEASKIDQMLDLFLSMRKS